MCVMDDVDSAGFALIDKALGQIEAAWGDAFPLGFEWIVNSGYNMGAVEAVAMRAIGVDGKAEIDNVDPPIW